MITVMQPESFARWSPGARRKAAYFIIWPGAGRDVEACVRLVVALGAGEEDAWRRTLIRTVRDGQRRALFVADADGQVAGYGGVVCVAADPQVAGAAPAGWYLLGWLPIRPGDGGDRRGTDTGPDGVGG